MAYEAEARWPAAEPTSNSLARRMFATCITASPVHLSLSCILVEKLLTARDTRSRCLPLFFLLFRATASVPVGRKFNFVNGFPCLAVHVTDFFLAGRIFFEGERINFALALRCRKCRRIFCCETLTQASSSASYREPKWATKPTASLRAALESRNQGRRFTQRTWQGAKGVQTRNMKML